MNAMQYIPGCDNITDTSCFHLLGVFCTGVRSIWESFFVGLLYFAYKDYIVSKRRDPNNQPLLIPWGKNSRQPNFYRNCNSINPS